MGRKVWTADDVLRHARAGAAELVVGESDLLTPLARDVASEQRLRIVVGRAGPEPTAEIVKPRVKHVPGASTLPLDPFPAELGRPRMDVRLKDVVTGADGLPMAAGVMSLREGTFAWHLDYDEVEYVIEGELHITTTADGGATSEDSVVVGRPGDVIAVPKGTSITFGTPSWAKFLYVTYPADWGGA